MQMKDLKSISLAASAAFVALAIQSCAIHVSRLNLGDPPTGESAPVTISSDKSSLSTIVDRLREKSEVPIVVSMDHHVAATTRFSGAVTADTWSEAFEKILQRTGVTYTRKPTTVPVFDIPKQN